jgi:hypothetical protein
MIQANFTYKVASNLRVDFSLGWASLWGAIGANGLNNRSGVFYNPADGSFTEVPATAMIGWDNSAATITGKNAIWVNSMYVTWNAGGFLNDFSVGKMPNPWGFKSLQFGNTSGADRVRWIGKTKIGPYMTLPIFFLELWADGAPTMNNTALNGYFGYDYKTTMGDELLLLQPAIIMIGPGQALEQIWFTLFHAGLRKYKDGLSYTGFDVYLVVRIGSMLKIDFEFGGFMGRLADTRGMALDIGHVRYDALKAIINVEFKPISLLKLTLEIALATAPNADYGKFGADYYDHPTFGGHKASGWGLSTQLYAFGGRIMNSNASGTNAWGTGGRGGLFLVALKVEADLMGGKINPWLKFAMAQNLAKYLHYTSSAFRTDLSKSLGMEIDLGCNFALADGFTLGIEFDFYIPSSAITNNERYVPDYNGMKSVYGIRVSFDLKF